jgi:hypothetical protein
VSVRAAGRWLRSIAAAGDDRRVAHQGTQGRPWRSPRDAGAKQRAKEEPARQERIRHRNGNKGYAARTVTINAMRATVAVSVA